MASIVQGLAYKAFGLQIHSEFPLPELPLTDQPGLIGSVSVLQEDLSERWQAIPKITPSLGVSGNEVMFEAKDTAIFSIRGGSTITVSPAPGADGDCVRLFILGSCMGVLLMQKFSLFTAVRLYWTTRLTRWLGVQGQVNRHSPPI